MRILHIADLHLGKSLKQQSFIHDQRDMLAQAVKAVVDEKPDVVVIAGDIYDSYVPSTEAVKIMDDFLHEVTMELHTPVLVISGNHDGAERLRFGNRLTRSVGYHVAGRLEDAFEPVKLDDEHGSVDFFLLPYAHLGLVRDYFGMEEPPTYAQAYQTMVDHILREKKKSDRCVLVTHAFVTQDGAIENADSDAVRDLPSVGGVQQVPASLFRPFNYVALGHLHSSNQLGWNHIRYAGSPLKYSISEEHHEKGFLLVDMDAQGQVTCRQIPVYPVKDLRRVTGTFDELMNHTICEDYVYLTLTDTTPVPDAMQRLRGKYPNALHLSHVNQKGQVIWQQAVRVDINQQQPIEIMSDFFQHVSNKELAEEAIRVLTETWESLDMEEEGDAE